MLQFDLRRRTGQCLHTQTEIRVRIASSQRAEAKRRDRSECRDRSSLSLNRRNNAKKRRSSWFGRRWTLEAIKFLLLMFVYSCVARSHNVHLSRWIQNPLRCERRRADLPDADSLPRTHTIEHCAERRRVRHLRRHSLCTFFSFVFSHRRSFPLRRDIKSTCLGMKKSSTL